MIGLRKIHVQSHNPQGPRPEVQMNRFEKLLREIDQKVREVKMLFAAILSKVDYEGARDELAKLVEILKDPHAAVDKKTSGHIGAEAELALRKINFWERKFLISEFALDAMRKRMTGLDPRTLDRYKEALSDRITRYDIVRSGREDLPELRRQFLSFKALMRQAEAYSADFIRKNASQVFGKTEVIGSAGRKIGRSAAKRLRDAQIRASMKGAKLQDDSNRGFKKKQKSA